MNKVLNRCTEMFLDSALDYTDNVRANNRFSVAYQISQVMENLYNEEDWKITFWEGELYGHDVHVDMTMIDEEEVVFKAAIVQDGVTIESFTESFEWNMEFNIENIEEVHNFIYGIACEIVR